eukprot:CAMPEP_0170591914 /NCGR_PEP_ID=MMETSP0224-20130122/12657_1 /TAXON_ID=285029 /ORGANISM="Togula jolla, Strain CCCM 725" /LENGTH=173 /DNA_ID=CAMNT_0010915809 /DNA_START=66 /DNA_END=587 /DNA_ORIENTATION=-
MLVRSCTRFAGRLSAPRFAVSMPGQVQAFGFGEVDPKNAPGMLPVQKKPPETVEDTVNYIVKGFSFPTRKEIIEGLGYPGQKHSAGGISTHGRLYYGPRRYDYGRPVMPKGWFANFFYGFWEFGHLMFVADRWQAIRWLRHFVMIGLCYFPFWLRMQWDLKELEEYKARFGPV